MSDSPLSLSHFLPLHFFWWVCILLSLTLQTSSLNVCINLTAYGWLTTIGCVVTTLATLGDWLVATIPISDIWERFDWSSLVHAHCRSPWRMGWEWNYHNISSIPGNLTMYGDRGWPKRRVDLFIAWPHKIPILLNGHLVANILFLK